MPSARGAAKLTFFFVFLVILFRSEFASLKERMIPVFDFTESHSQEFPNFRRIFVE